MARRKPAPAAPAPVVQAPAPVAAVPAPPAVDPALELAREHFRLHAHGTRADVEHVLERFELAHPVEPDDLRVVKAALDASLPVGFRSELVLRGDRVQVNITIGNDLAPTDPFWLPIAGDAPPAVGLASRLASGA